MNLPKVLEKDGITGAKVSRADYAALTAVAVRQGITRNRLLRLAIAEILAKKTSQENQNPGVE